MLVLNSIPNKIRVVAFVECGLTDISAETIINCDYEAKSLQALYFEGNFFARKMHEKFTVLTDAKPGLTVMSEWPIDQFKSMMNSHKIKYLLF